jgi:hypothetical protein
VLVICKDEVPAKYENGAYRIGLNGGSLYICAFYYLFIYFYYFFGMTRLCYPNVRGGIKGQASWVAAPAPTYQRR